MKGDEESLESFLKKWDVPVNLLALDKPASIFVPDGLVEGLDSLGEAIISHVVFNLLQTVVDLTADPVLALIEGGVGDALVISRPRSLRPVVTGFALFARVVTLAGHGLKTFILRECVT